MIKPAVQPKSGAPLKALFLLSVLWISGRLIWDSFLPMPNRVATASALGRTFAAEFPGPGAPDGSSNVPSANILTQSRPFGPSVVAAIDATASKNVAAGSEITYRETHPLNSPDRMIYGKETDLIHGPRNSRKTTHQSGYLAINGSGLYDLAPSLSASPDQDSRFSGYFWLYARQGSNQFTQSRSLPSQLALGAQAPGSQYGGSQVGAIVSYRALGDENRGLSLFARGSSALSAAGQEELAVGLKVKPVAVIPVSFYLEQRLGNRAEGNLGTAAYLAGGTGPEPVVGNMEFETYGQVGYIFAESSSYFFDASTTLQQPIVEDNSRQITIGAGIWTGGQKGVMRVDIGPRAVIKMPLGNTMTRLSVDWRNRVAGDAAPGSGIAVSLTSGF